MTYQQKWELLKQELDTMMADTEMDLRYQADCSTSYQLAKQNAFRMLIQLRAYMTGLEDYDKEKAD